MLHRIFSEVRAPVGKTIEVGSEPYIIVGVITQSEDSMPKINTISEYEEYSQTIMGSVMSPGYYLACCI